MGLSLHKANTSEQNPGVNKKYQHVLFLVTSPPIYESPNKLEGLWLDSSRFVFNLNRSATSMSVVSLCG